MAEERVLRRLAAIVATDVTGYSQPIGSDEDGTLATLMDHRTELIDPQMSDYGGRIANTADEGGAAAGCIASPSPRVAPAG